MIGNELCILAMGTVVVAPVEYAYGIILLRQIAEEFTKAALVFFFQLRAGRHVERKSQVQQIFRRKGEGKVR